MKIFFATSHRGKKEFIKHYRIIYEEAKQLGYKHIDYDLFSTSTEDFYQKLIAGGKKADVELYKARIQSINEADICIFDCSYPSLSIGFLIDKSLEQGKPTIVLYFKDKGKDTTPYFISGIDNERLILQGYTEKTLKKIIRDSLELAKERRDKRFNFFISPRLLEYLEKVSKEEGMTKSKFIRNLILEHMHKSS